MEIQDNLDFPKAQADSREVVHSLQKGYDPEADATDLENIETYLHTVQSAVDEVRRRREAAEHIVGHVTFGSTYESGADPAIGIEEYDAESKSIIDALHAAEGLTVQRSYFYENGFLGVTKGISEEARGERFKLRMRKLIDAGIVEKVGRISYRLVRSIEVSEDDELQEKKVEPDFLDVSN